MESKGTWLILGGASMLMALQGRLLAISCLTTSMNRIDTEELWDVHDMDCQTVHTLTVLIGCHDHQHPQVAGGERGQDHVLSARSHQCEAWRSC